MTDEIDWRAYYEKEHEVCDLAPSTNAAEMHRCLAAWSVFPRGKAGSILDVGCGDGFFCHWIAAKTRARRVAGTDVSEGRLQRARARYPEIEYVTAGIENLPFSDSEFDIVTAIEVLEHLPDPATALGEVARVAKRHVVLTVPNNEKPAVTLCPRCMKTYPRDGHLHSFDHASMERLARGAGLTLERIKGYSFTVGLVRDALPCLLGSAVGWVLERFAKSPGTYLAARMRKV